MHLTHNRPFGDDFTGYKTHPTGSKHRRTADSINPAAAINMYRGWFRVGKRGTARSHC